MSRRLWNPMAPGDWFTYLVCMSAVLAYLALLYGSLQLFFPGAWPLLPSDQGFPA